MARPIHALGALSLLAMLAHTALSVFLAATQPTLDPAFPRQWWFRHLREPLAWLPAFLTDALRGAGPLATGGGFLVGYCAPLLISTACGLALLVALERRRHANGTAPALRGGAPVSDDDARRVLRWAIAFGVVAMPAFNVLTQDIWLSVAWGRALNHGINPFASAYPRGLAADLPLEYDPMPMTYGPCWAAVCSIAVAVSGGSAIAAWCVLKLVLGGAWIACLWSVSTITRPLGAWRRTLAIALTGWLPLGVHCGVAEGHNDVLMVAAALLWAGWMPGPAARGPLWLAVSILTKYVTAPLALVDAVFHWRARSMTVTRYVIRVLPALLLLLGGAALVAMSVRGFDQTSAMREWKFLDPADAIRLIARYSRLPLAAAAVPIVAGLFGAIAVAELIRLAKAPTRDNAHRAQLAVMALILLAVTGHVWPWFFIWCLPFAALVPSFWLARFVTGAAIIAPFTTFHWWHFGSQGAIRSEWPAVLMYGVALVVAVGCRRAFGEAPEVDTARARHTAAAA